MKDIIGVPTKVGDLVACGTGVRVRKANLPNSRIYMVRTISKLGRAVIVDLGTNKSRGITSMAFVRISEDLLDEKTLHQLKECRKIYFKT